jgi:hypothetical protein
LAAVVIVIDAAVRDLRPMLMRTAVAALALSAACSAHEDKKSQPSGSAAIAMKPTASETGRTPTTAATAPSAPATSEPIDVTGRRLYSDYAKSKVAADEKYRNKLVRMIGVVDHMAKDVVYFDGPAETVGIRAHFSEANGVGSLKRYESVRVRCRGDGIFGGRVMLENCSIEDDKNKPPVTVTAKRLYADYTKDEDGARIAYEGRILLVTGAIGQVGKDVMEQDDPPIVLFATPPGAVQANVGDAAKSLRRGQTATLRCTDAGFELATPMLIDCTINQ